MAEATLFDIQGKEKEKKELAGDLFNSEPKLNLLHEYVTGYQRNQRQGSASTKTRSMVSGGGRKPWRQKGTGRARSGTNRSPIWEGGGIVWGPHPREYYRPIARKFKRAALKSGFSLRASEGKIRIVDIPEFDKPSTKTMADFLKAHGVYHERVLLLFEGKIEHLKKSCDNIKYCESKSAALVNPFDLIWAEHVLITPEALAKVEEVFNN